MRAGAGTVNVESVQVQEAHRRILGRNLVVDPKHPVVRMWLRGLQLGTVLAMCFNTFRVAIGRPGNNRRDPVVTPRGARGISRRRLHDAVSPPAAGRYARVT